MADTTSVTAQQGSISGGARVLPPEIHQSTITYSDKEREEQLNNDLIGMGAQFQQGK